MCEVQEEQRAITSCAPARKLVALYHVGDDVSPETIKLPVVMLTVRLIDGLEIVDTYVADTDKLDVTNDPIEKAENVLGGRYVHIVSGEAFDHEER